jgi:hypothetical protein
MLTRAIITWCILLAIAFANGGFREIVLIPRLGDLAAHAVSTLMLSAAILLLSWLTIKWMHPATFREAWVIGGVWVTLTLAFEFLAGHYAFGDPWSQLLADYNIFRGRIWVLVPVTTAIAPALAAYLRQLLPVLGER